MQFCWGQLGLCEIKVSNYNSNNPFYIYKHGDVKKNRDLFNEIRDGTDGDALTIINNAKNYNGMVFLLDCYHILSRQLSPEYKIFQLNIKT